MKILGTLGLPSLYSLVYYRLAPNTRLPRIMLDAPMHTMHTLLVYRINVYEIVIHIYVYISFL